MSTRSQIGILHRDGSITTHYCQSDGYFSWNGRLLHTHYQDRSKVQQLIDLGMQSVLRENIGEKHDFSWASKMEQLAGETWQECHQRQHDDVRSTYCLFYHRDRGDDFIPPESFASVEDFMGAGMAEQYFYLYDDTRGAWIGCKTNVDDADKLNWHLLSDLAAVDWNDGIENWEDTVTVPSVAIVPLIDDNSPEEIVKALAPANDVEAIDMDDPAARAIF